jgi:hypothetical protein
VTTTGAELNVIDGNTSATSTTVTASDSIVFNDNGVMKQVSMADINTYIQSQVSQPTVNNNTITITAGDVLTGGGTFTTNGGATSITLNHQDVSSQGSVNGSGNTFIQDVTLDGYGHVTGLGTATVASGSSGGIVKMGSSYTYPAGDYVAFNANPNQYYWQVNLNGSQVGTQTNGMFMYFTTSTTGYFSTYSFNTSTHRIAIFTAA